MINIKRIFSNKANLILISSIALISLFLGFFSITRYKNESDEITINIAHAESENPLTINSSIVGPFDETSGDVNWGIALSSSVYFPQVREIFLYGTDANNIGHSSSTAIHSMEANVTYNVSFTFPGEQIGKYGSRYIRFVVRNEATKAIIYEKSCIISRIGRDTLNANSHLGRSWQSNILALRIQNSEFVYYGDALSLSDTVDFLAVDYYYRLDLSSIVFQFISPVNTYDKAEISFEDEYNIFPDFDKDENGVIHLPLIVDMGKMPIISLKYKKGFYVDPKNLHMSSSIKTGYQATNYFYFPVNELNKINDYVFNVEIAGIGLNKSKITLSLDYDVTQRLIGRCDESEYCVTGGVVS